MSRKAHEIVRVRGRPRRKPLTIWTGWEWPRLRGGLDLPILLPIPRQELVDALGGMIGQARQDVGQPSLWIDVAELCGFDQRIDGGGAAATLVGASERPIFSVM